MARAVLQRGGRVVCRWCGTTSAAGPSGPRVSAFQPTIVLGLGNPGMDGTRHNAGVAVLEAALRAVSCPTSWRRHDSARGCRVVEVPAWNAVFVRLNCAMNVSGPPIARLKRLLGAELILVHDDMELPLGRAALKLGGSAKGHNGVRSVYEACGTTDLWRVRVGIGRPPAGDVADFVLRRFDETERAGLEAGVRAAIALVRQACAEVAAFHDAAPAGAGATATRGAAATVTAGVSGSGSSRPVGARP
jgi:PTH1 family peptidyl-tRNA hydrolase